MNLPRFSVQNPVPVNLLMVGLLAAGVFAATNLVREFFPTFEAEQISIVVPYPGATPEDIERTVTRIVEREVEDVEGVDEISSRIFEGLTTIALKLDEGVDRVKVLSDVRSRIDQVKPQLPDGAEEPEIAESRPYIPAIAVVVHGDVEESRLRRVVQEVEDDLLDFPEITELVTLGIREREFVVEISPEQLEAHGIGFEEVGRAIGALNLDLPGGQLESDVRNIRVRTMGEGRTAREIEALVLLTSPAGTRLTVGDLGTVRPAFEDVIERGRFATRRAASISVFKTPEQDAIAIAERVRAYVAGKPTRLGGALQLSVTTDLSRFIEQRLDLMTRNALAGLALVLLTLAVFLEVRVAFWVAAGLGISFAGTFLVMLLTGQTINLISLFGLIVVLGLIVDDAIVVAENIFTKRRSGLPAVLAAERGANEVAIPVVAAVATTCAAFAPLAFMEGRMGDFLGVMPAVVVSALLISLVEAFAILPRHLAHEPRKGGDVGFLGPIKRFGERLDAARHRLFEERLPAALGWLLNRLMPLRYGVVGIALGLLIFSGGLIAGGHVPFVFLQETDALTLTGQLEMAAGTPEEETTRALERIERLALAQPEVKTVFSVVGSSFNDRGRQAAADPATVGQTIIELEDAEIREAKGQRTSIDLLSFLRVASADLPNVKRLSFAAQGGGPRGADVEIRVRASSMEKLGQGVAHVTEKIDAFDGVTEIYDDYQLGKVEARLSLRPAARLAGLTTIGLAQQVRAALFGFEAQDLQIGDDEVTVRAVLPASARQTLSDLARFRIALPGGGRMPLEEAVSIQMERGYASLGRVDGRRSATVRAEVDETRVNVDGVNNALAKDLADISESLPGVSISFEGQKRQTQESFGSLRVLFPIALALIFGIIAVLFRSYLQPIVVMSAIPFAIFGAVIGHMIMGYPMTLLSMIGIVALAGIVVNDGLILVDLANRLRREGKSLHEAVVGAAQGRMRAILLTSITTCAGLAPLMLERSFQAQFLIPMAVSIVFGLAFATFIILILLPMHYLIFEDLRGVFRWLTGGAFSRHLPYDPKTAFAEAEADAARAPPR